MTKRPWRLAKALGGGPTEGLLGEINRVSPDRNRKSDGGIGDVAHSARTSDHNPCDCCGIVCARDFTHDPPRFDSYAFAEWLRKRVLGGELRVKYVISDGKIFSGWGQKHQPAVWRPYSGKNRHAHHVHVSVRHDAAYYDDAAPWGWGEEDQS